MWDSNSWVALNLWEDGVWEGRLDGVNAGNVVGHGEVWKRAEAEAVRNQAMQLCIT